jgi:hypothetical protein
VFVRTLSSPDLAANQERALREQGPCGPATAEACLILPPPRRDGHGTVHVSPTLMKQVTQGRALMPLVLTCGLRDTTSKQGSKQATTGSWSEIKQWRSRSLHHGRLGYGKTSEWQADRVWGSLAPAFGFHLQTGPTPPEFHAAGDAEPRRWLHGNHNLFGTLLPSVFTRSVW